MIKYAVSVNVAFTVEVDDDEEYPEEKAMELARERIKPLGKLRLSAEKPHVERDE